MKGQEQPFLSPSSAYWASCCSELLLPYLLSAFGDLVLLAAQALTGAHLLGLPLKWWGVVSTSKHSW
jgi:hypothetical protein